MSHMQVVARSSRHQQVEASRNLLEEFGSRNRVQGNGPQESPVGPATGFSGHTAPTADLLAGKNSDAHVTTPTRATGDAWHPSRPGAPIPKTQNGTFASLELPNRNSRKNPDLGACKSPGEWPWCTLVVCRTKSD